MAGPARPAAPTARPGPAATSAARPGCEYGMPCMRACSAPHRQAPVADDVERRPEERMRHARVFEHRQLRDLHRPHQVGALGQFRSEEHTSELQSLMRISYAVFCLTKKNKYNNRQ